MGRFFREFRYSMKAKGHVFFLVLLFTAATLAVWLFYLTVSRELDSSFADSETSKTGKLHITGSFDDMAQATDSDLEAELAFNKALHSADWMTYSEAVREDLYIQDYEGSVTALVGYEEGNCADNREITKNNKTYAYVKAVWADSQAALDAGLGTVAGELFETPTDYYGHLYVALGYGYRENGVYKAGSILNLATEQGVTTAAVIGFLDEGATIEIGGQSICLDNYMFCPLVDLSGLYDGETAESTSPLYVNDALINENEALDDLICTDCHDRTVGGTTYTAYKTLWIEESEAENAASGTWLKNLYNAAHYAPVNCMAIGSRYEEAGLTNKSVKALLFGSETTVSAGTVIPAGTEYNGICLDDYLVLLKTDYESYYFKTETKTETPGVTAEAAESGEDASVIEESAEDRTVTFTQSERTMLMHILYLKNSGTAETGCTANDSERRLMSVIDSAWEDFYRENENQSPITSYRIKEAAGTDSILFRDNISSVTDSIGKYIRYFLPAAAVLLFLYYLRKRSVLREYFTTLILTGTSNLEIMLLFLTESIFLYLGVVILGYGSCYAVCRILQLDIVSVREMLGTTAKIVLFPTLGILLIIFFTDYGKLFRRGRKG